MEPVRKCLIQGCGGAIGLIDNDVGSDAPFYTFRRICPIHGRAWMNWEPFEGFTDAQVIAAQEGPEDNPRIEWGTAFEIWTHNQGHK